LPAARSRTENWRSLLDTIAQRGGALEVSVFREDSTGEQAGPDVVWRVRLLRLNDNDILVESPSAAGVTLGLKPETPVLVAMTVGQNRWMFHSRVLGGWQGQDQSGRRQTLALALPERVERCSRRQFFRISTGGMRLAPVRCWALMDPTSAVEAERHNQRIVRAAMEAGARSATAAGGSSDSGPLPQVGPTFHANLLNLSGGGLGLLLPAGDSPFNRGKFFWLSIDLRPDLPEPLCVTARLAHTHLDSHQQTYAGLAFDFTFHPEHQAFITELLARYVERLHDLGQPEQPVTRAA
jgi:hypothetical protein